MVIKKAYLKLQNLIGCNNPGIKNIEYLCYTSNCYKKKFAPRGEVGAQAPIWLGRMEDTIHHLLTVVADTLLLLTQESAKVQVQVGGQPSLQSSKEAPHSWVLNLCVTISIFNARKPIPVQFSNDTTTPCGLQVSLPYLSHPLLPQDTTAFKRNFICLARSQKHGSEIWSLECN